MGSHCHQATAIATSEQRNHFKLETGDADEQVTLAAGDRGLNDQIHHIMGLSRCCKVLSWTGLLTVRMTTAAARASKPAHHFQSLWGSAWWDHGAMWDRPVHLGSMKEAD